MNIAAMAQIVTAIPAVLNAVQTLVILAEEGFGDGSGSVKKEFVMSGIQSFAGLMEGFSTGGQKDTWGEINQNWDVFSGAVSAIVDFFAGLNFPK
jgi:hypothetical protein